MCWVTHRARCIERRERFGIHFGFRRRFKVHIFPLPLVTTMGMELLSRADALARKRFLHEYDNEIWRLFTSLVDYSRDLGLPLLQHASYPAFVEFVLASSTISLPARPLVWGQPPFCHGPLSCYPSSVGTSKQEAPMQSQDSTSASDSAPEATQPGPLYPQATSC